MRIKKLFSLVAVSVLLAINITSPIKVLADDSGAIQVNANMDNWQDADKTTYNIEYIERGTSYKVDTIEENSKATNYELNDYGNWEYVGWVNSPKDDYVTESELYDFNKPVTSDLWLNALYKQSIKPEISVLSKDGTFLFTKQLNTLTGYSIKPSAMDKASLELFFRDSSGKSIKFADNTKKSLESSISDYAIHILHFYNPNIEYITHLDGLAYKDANWYSDKDCITDISTVVKRNQSVYTKFIVDLICEHKYQVTIEKQPTCTEKGTRVYTCSCGDRYTEEISPLGHIEQAPVIENKVEPTYEAEGSYDEVVYCARCNEELNRTHKTIAKLIHTHNYKLTDSKEATCIVKGYEKFECECGDAYFNYSDALGHIEGKVVIENRVEAKEGIEGSYDEVIYCDRCHEELKRTHNIIPALPIPDKPEPPTEPETTPEPPVKEETDNNVATIAVVGTVATVSGGGAGAFFFIFWWRRRKVKGAVSGNVIANLRVTLTGKDNLETFTNEYGEFEFKNVKSDNLLLTIYDENEAVIFSSEIYTKGKNNEDTFEVIDNHTEVYELNKRGKTYTVNIER